MATSTKIRRAAMLRHQGKSFAEIAEIVGVKSPTTIFRWEKTPEWEDETRLLQEIDVQELNKEYLAILNQTRKKFEKVGQTSFDISVLLLAKIKRLTDKIDIDSFKNSREQIQALQTLVSTFEKMSVGGKTLFLESVGLEDALKTLEALK